MALPDHLFGPPPAETADAKNAAETDPDLADSSLVPPDDRPGDSAAPRPSPSMDSVAEAYQQLTASAHTSLGAEIAVLRGLLRLTLSELADPRLGPRGRFRLRDQAAALAQGVARVARADRLGHTANDEAMARYFERLDKASFRD